MIDLYSWYTPNGWKISIALEELGLPYRLHPVNITLGEQHRPEYLAINPNNRIPAIIDQEAEGGPLTVFESGAILQYLAEKTGRLCPGDPRGRIEVTKWLMWQMGGLGPMCGQLHHFALFAPERIPYAIERYSREAARLYGVMNRRLADRPFLAGDYSIADIACFAWVVPHEFQGQSLDDFPNVKRWFREISGRPAVIRGLQVGVELQQQQRPMVDETRTILFGHSGETDRLDNLMHPEVLADPYPLYRRLREEDPVHWNPLVQHFLVTRHDDVCALFEHPAISHRPSYSFIRPLTPEEEACKERITAFFSRWIILTDPPQHGRLRGLLHRAFTPRVVEGMRARVQAIADELISDAQSRGGMDVVQALAYPLPVRVTATLLGVPEDERDGFRHLCERLSAFLSMISPAPGELQQVEHAVDEIRALLGRVVSARRARPAEDLVSALCAADADGVALTEDEIVATCVNLFFAGHETTANAIGNGLLALLQHPEELALLRARPELIGSAVEEMLRYDTSGHWFHLKAREAFELRGRQIPRGGRIMAGLAAAGRDPVQYPDPDRFDIQRRVQAPIYFGRGAHHCLGAVLARMEMEIAIGTLVRQAPGLRLAADEPRWRPNFVFRGLASLPVTM